MAVGDVEGRREKQRALCNRLVQYGELMTVCRMTIKTPIYSSTIVAY